MSARLRSRRDFMQTALTAGAGVLLASIDAAGQPRTRGRIDVHHHCRTPAQGAGRAPGADWSPQKSIEQMDKFGIATSLISATVPAEPFYDGTEKSRTVARSVNDFIAKWIGDTSFTPVLDELNRRRAFVYTHGAAPGCCGGSFVPGVPEITVEYNTDVSRAIVSLLTSGTADRTPNVAYVLSHGGGTITGLAGRILGGEASAERLAATPAVNPRLYHLRRFYYDTAISTSPIQMQALKSLIGTSQILCGTDYPFGRAAPTAAALRQSGLTAGELRDIDRNNILRALPNLAR